MSNDSLYAYAYYVGVIIVIFRFLFPVISYALKPLHKFADKDSS